MFAFWQSAQALQPWLLIFNLNLYQFEEFRENPDQILAGILPP